MSDKQENQNISTKDSEDKTNKMIYIYQNLFVSSVLAIVNLLRDVGNKNKDNIPTDKKPSFEKLFSTCEEVIIQYKNTEKNTDVDQVKVIKKVFKVLTSNLDFVKSRNNNLFTVRTPEGKIHTIIPGLNINLCVPFFTEEESNILWESLESMFVTSVRMVYMMTDKSRHKEDITNLTNELEQKSMKKLNNFFMGLNVINEEGTLNMEQLMTSDIVIPGTEANSGFLGKLGVDKIMNPAALGDEIKKFNEKYLAKFKVLVKVLPLEDKAIEMALVSNFNDFEDGLQYFVAMDNESDIIITRNKKDFKNSKIPVMTAGEYIRK
jgi:hypothetical protein